MEDWIPFEEGNYRVIRAALLNADRTAELLEHTYISVFQGRGGRRTLSGRGRARSTHIVTLLEDHNNLDLVLDFGEGYHYLMEEPEIKSGKIFSPEVRSTVQFFPGKAWEPLTPDAFETLWSELTFISD